MTRIANAPHDVVAEAPAGFVRAHDQTIRAVDGGVVRRTPIADGMVALVVGGALTAAADAAADAARDTSRQRPTLGRARPLAERSIGHPDAEATSLALLATTVADTYRKDTE